MTEPENANDQPPPEKKKASALSKVVGWVIPITIAAVYVYWSTGRPPPACDDKETVALATEVLSRHVAIRLPIAEGVLRDITEVSYINNPRDFGMNADVRVCQARMQFSEHHEDVQWRVNWDEGSGLRAKQFNVTTHEVLPGCTSSIAINQALKALQENGMHGDLAILNPHQLYNDEQTPQRVCRGTLQRGETSNVLDYTVTGHEGARDRFRVLWRIYRDGETPLM